MTIDGAEELDLDLIVLGGGSGGYATALRASQLGMRVGLVEEDLLGGTCLHRGCIPTKALLHAAEVADAVRCAGNIGIRATFEEVDALALTAYRTSLVDRLHRGLVGLVDSAGIRVFHGRGTLIDAHSVQVGQTRLRADHVVLATGAQPRLLPGVEIGPRVLTSAEALALDNVPQSAIVIGGSVIGVEFASAWRSLGSTVTVVEALPTLVPLEDPSLAGVLERSFRRRGIAVRSGVRVSAVEVSDRDVTVTLADDGRVTADVVLVAIGRAPRSSDLGLERVGVETDRGWVVVDERLRTTVATVRAVGDLVPGPQLAHRGFAHGIFVAEDLAGLDPAPVIDSEIPRVTYSEPELASVGLTEAQAERDFGGDRIGVVEYDLAGNGRSQVLQTNGIVKVVRRTDGPIVGVHLAGARVGELIGEAAAWICWEAHPEDVAGQLHAHPTQNEALGEAALVLAGKALHAHA